MVSDGQEQYGEPEEWEFDYPWRMVQTGFWLWAMSDFKHLPTQDEIDVYDQRWVDDMKLAMTLYKHQGNNSAPQRLVEDFIAKEQVQQRLNPEAFDDNGKRKRRNAITVLQTSQNTGTGS